MVMTPVTVVRWGDKQQKGESRRIVMKDVLRTQGDGVEVKSRAVPQSAIDHFRCVRVFSKDRTG